ncbi:MAG: hypothetical protein M3083_00655 [Actinomycetota bacterium]|nr:hypothetical protein [Actinomycetota bacterium]MDQ6945086.1 hypothetical protein [Actinomycetota bacterium]
MAVLGFSCKVEKGRTATHGVLAEGSGDQVQLTEVFSHLGDRQEDLAQQLCSLMWSADSALRDLNVEAAVVRSMDWDGRQRVTDQTRQRFAAEGVLLAVIRARGIQRVEPLSGREIGARCGSSKEAVAARAAVLVRSRSVEAGMAALAALEDG